MLIKGELRYIQILKDRGTCIDSRLDEIKEQLLRGDKFEQMWERVMDYVFYDNKGMSIIPSYGMDEVAKRLNKLKQKYFPKPIKKTITFTIEASTANQLGTAINDFEMFWAGYNEVKGHCIKYSYEKGR